MSKEKTVAVTDYSGQEVLGEVHYTENLDYWDGSNWSCGSTGRHKGLAQMGNAWVLLHGTNWQGERDSAEIISAKEACEEILKSGNIELFETFPDLQIEREKLNQKKPKSEHVHFRLSPERKKRWAAQAELKGVELTELIISAVEKYIN